jgi:hypothetical protein
MCLFAPTRVGFPTFLTRVSGSGAILLRRGSCAYVTQITRGCDWDYTANIVRRFALGGSVESGFPPPEGGLRTRAINLRMPTAYRN